MSTTKSFNLSNTSDMGSASPSKYIAPSQYAIKQYADTVVGTHAVKSVSYTAGTQSQSERWTCPGVDGRSDLYDGCRVVMLIPHVNANETGTAFSIDNGTTYHPVYYGNSMLSAQTESGWWIMLCYNATKVGTMYVSGQTQSVTGIWEYVGAAVTSGVQGAEVTSNKVTSLSSASTHTQYPSAKCVYDLIGPIDTALDAILNGTN